MKKIVITVLILAFIAFLVINKAFLQPGNPAAEQKRTGPVPSKATVEVYVVKPENFSSDITATGSVLPDEAVEIRSELPGKITHINFQEGARVRKGQVLFRVNAAEMEAELQKLRENLRLHQDMEQRQRTLLEKEYISKQEYDQALNRSRTAAADLQALQAQLAKSVVRAPFDGMVGLRQVSEGSYVTPTTPITTLVRTQPVKIDFALPGRYRESVRTGDSVSFTLEGNPKIFSAIVYAIEPQIDPQTRTLPVRARYANRNEEVLPGSFVRVELALKQMPDAILIPNEAIIPEMNGHKVFLVKEGKAQPQPVKIGLRSDRMIQIVEGLQAGDTVIYSGIMQLRPGAPVNIRAVK